MDYIGILSTVISIAIGAIPVVMVIFKKLGKVSKESGELFPAISKGLEDGKLTGDEIRGIISEAKDVGKAVMEIRNKSL